MEEGPVCLDIGKEDTLRGELKRDREILMNNSESEQFPNKKQAKEISNEDIKSEVSNPVVSPKENASICQDITSQPTELATCNQVGSGEITSTCSGNSSPSDTSSDEGEDSSENNDTRSDSTHNGTSSSISTSHVVLEIPKHASTSGIRKITFKFSKRKEDYDNQAIASVGTGIGEQLPFSDMNSYGDWVDPAAEMIQGRERYFCVPNMELKMSKKVVPSNYPTNVKKLLSTGILDGARVKYFSPERELDGVIEGGGYLCGCSLCGFSRVLSAYEFEQHAGAKTRHPNNHIFLENGKPICSIIQELKSAPFNSVDEVIKDVAGSAINDGCFQVWKASLHQRSGTVEPYRKCSSRLPYIPHSYGSCFEQGSEENCYASSSSFMYNNCPFRHQRYMEPSEDQKRPLKRPISLVHEKKTNEGSTKKRDNDLHRMLFMPNGLPDGAELAYYVKGHKMLAGYKQGNGIFCSCCEREISPSQFEAHAGMAARRQPYRHIYTTNGLTLHDLAISLASGKGFTTAGVSDDMCSKCGDGGDLISCENCPQAFHAACLDLQCSPKGPWHCPNCKTFGHGGNLARPIVIRLSRVVKSPEYEVGGCAICRAHDFSTRYFDDRTVILCDQCEREFHVGCLRESGICDLKGIPKEKWFCSNDCNQIYVALQNSVSIGVQMIPALQLNIISRKHAEKGLHIEGSTDELQWRILMGKSRNNEDLSLLSGAASIFRECFDPIVAKSGRDLIPVMVYGRNISGQEFGGMYCIVLLVKNVVVSAGLLRIFGRDVAELPLVATSREHQGKGYFQALFSCIERLLYNLNVVNLVLPAAEEAESIWTRRFGFRKMSELEVAKCAREVQLTIFKGTSMLQKAVPQMIE